MKTTDKTCPHCPRRLQNTMERRIAAHRMPEVQRVLAYGNCFAERHPTGIELIGECIEHGLVRVPLFGQEKFVRS